MDKMPKVEFVGVACNMPGTSGFTMAAFQADEVPPGTRLYMKPQVLDAVSFEEWYEKRYGKIDRSNVWDNAKCADAREVWNASQAAKVAEKWNEGEPDIPLRTIREFTVAVHRQGIPGRPYVFSAFYSNEFQISRDGEFLAKGWYRKDIGSKYYKLLGGGDVLRGWMELPEFSE